MNVDYCYNNCEKGISIRKDFLEKNDSVYDAIMDFQDFAGTCFETCPYKDRHKSMKVCCISAKARHGKDTAAAILAEYLESKDKKVLITHFADLLKFICVKFFGWNGDKDEAGRSLLQYIGTDVIGTKRPEYWATFIVDILKFFEKEWDYVLIPDCRYPVEVLTMKDSFETVVLRVERPNFESNLTEEQKNHASEIKMDDYDFDAVVYNDGSLDDFKEKLTVFADNFLFEE